jgi:autotransporter-associated beta strand protein
VELAKSGSGPERPAKSIRLAINVAAALAALQLFSASNGSAQTLAFPEAEGFGRFAQGPRANLASATVYHVTNLNDSGAGSLRDALSGSNRYVVFDVGGIVNLSSVVTVASNVYIAGQTAPGGIGVYNNRVAFHGANNLISRYWNVRLGTSQGRQDAASLVRGQNMIWDHMSITWGVDGTFDINPDTGQVIDNITIQNSAVAQGLDVVGHSTGGLLTIGEGNRSSIIKSLWADNVTRNPKLRGDNEFINNVVYGYQTSGYIMGDTTAVSNANAIGNYFIEGPVDGSSPFASGTSSFNIYGADNWVDGNKDGILNGSQTSSYPGANVVATPHAFPTSASMTAQQAVAFVAENFGPNITRDAVDKRLAQEVLSYGTLGGVIVRDSDLFPGYGTDPVYLNPRARLTDTDNDGMPDNWETAKGLNPNSNADWKGLNAAGYTRLEEYLNELGGYGVTRIAPASGAWITAATWGGTLPNFATTAIVANGITVSSGQAFARHANLDGTSTASGGTLDVFDTLLVGSNAFGALTITGGTVSAGRVMLGAPGQSGVLTLNAGTLQTGPIVPGGGTGSLVLNGGTFRATGAINVAVPTSVAGAVTFNTNGFSGSITGGLSGTGTLTKTGAGTLTLGGVNTTYSGQINLNAGTIVLATNAANSSTGAIMAANGTTLQVTTSGASTPLALASGATVNLTAGGLTYNGPISGPVGTTLLIANSSTGTSNFSVNGSLANFFGTFSLGTSTGNIRVGSTGSPNVAFNLGTSTATLRTTFDGTVQLGSLTGGASSRLTGSTNGTVATTYVIGGLNTSTSFPGTIADGTSATPGITNITKTGTGTLTLTGANVYTGRTTVQAGTLRLGTAAQSPVMTTGLGADIAGGRLVLDYTSGSTLPATVVSLLKTSFDANGLTSGRIMSSTATASRGIGWTNDTTALQVILAPALYGDANLDNTVNFDDLLILAANYNGSAKSWTQGDSTYDGAVNFDDLLKLAANYNQSMAGEWALALASVPEPTTLALLGAGSLLVLRRKS